MVTSQKSHKRRESHNIRKSIRRPQIMGGGDKETGGRGRKGPASGFSGKESRKRSAKTDFCRRSYRKERVALEKGGRKIVQGLYWRTG